MPSTPPETPQAKRSSSSFAPIARAATGRNVALVSVALLIAASLPSTLAEIANPITRTGAALAAVVVVLVAGRFLENGR